MSTTQKGLNVDLTAFKPFPYDYRLFIFYTSLFSRVFIRFHLQNFCIFIQKRRIY